MEPWKFRNVTNGIDHRRWLSEINPGLDGLIRDLTGGDDYLLHPQALKKLDDYADDASVLESWVPSSGPTRRPSPPMQETRGVELNPDYFRDGVGYLESADAEKDAPTLFDLLENGA